MLQGQWGHRLVKGRGVQLPTKQHDEGLTGRIFVTGGAGFLGRGLIRAAERESWDCQFTIYSRDEEKQHKLRRRWPLVRCVLGDVRDRDRLEQSMAGHDIVIHAAAVKFIPEAEANVSEAISVNVGGSQNVVNAALGGAAWPKTVVGISTDKAALPVNTYGATKMLMERMFTRASAGISWKPNFVSVRYGNVVGSTGSIIPLFQDQLRRNGKVTVTDPTMSRFWISVDDAVKLIVLAVKLSSTRLGGIIVPRCKSMNIGKLAEMIVGDQIDSDAIEIVGARPGEKKHEELVHFQESVLAEKWNDDYFVLHPQADENKWLNKGQEPWTYSSLYAERLSAEEMQAMIEDAEDLAF